jgi:CheY-like chemotaxis protein
VVLNLISNAARFTENGSISIDATRKDHYAIVSVTDTGPGISPKDAEKIFEPFCQGTGRLWRDKGGSGLGLSISKQFVELHGGHIWLNSEPGIGTTFSFDLPISAPIEHIARPGHWIKEGWSWIERRPSPNLPDLPSGPRIVLCDETGDLLGHFTRLSDEVEFVDTRDVAQAAQELHRCPAHALVVNSSSPASLWPSIEQARMSIPDMPIIGCSVPPHVEGALKAGASGYLTKPVTRAELQKAIQEANKPIRRILVVDDDPDVLRLFARMLHTLDGSLEVISALNGEQALEELRSGSPDLVLLDIVMPDMDGWQVLMHKQQDVLIRDIPVVLVSAQDPADRPLVSPIIVAAMGEGVALNKVLRCSLELSKLLPQPV